MKLNKTIYVLSLAGMLGLWSCTSDEAMPDSNIASGERVPITIEVSHGGDAQTRTDLLEDLQEGGLTHTWTAGDEVVFYNSNGQEAGKLTLQEGEGTSKGIFTGTVTAESGKYHLWYFGRPQAEAGASLADRYPYLDFDAGKVTLNFANQNFKSVDDLTAVDVLSQDVDIIVKGGKGYVEKSIFMNPHVAMARFKVSGLPEGTTGTLKILNKLTSINTSGNKVYQIYYKHPMLLSGSGGNAGGNSTTSNGFSYENVTNGSDIYVAFIPNAYELIFEFTSNDGTKKYSRLFNNNSLEEGIYYQTFNKGINDNSGTSEGIVIDLNDSPASTNNWGGAGIDILPSYTDSKSTSPKYSSDYGWCNNDYSVYETGAWNDPITYHYNGIVGGALYSTNEASPSYYQWGRWMGFPYYSDMIQINSFGQPVNDNYKYHDNNSYVLGETVRKAPYVYTNTQYNSVYGGAFAKMNTKAYFSQGWDNEMALKASVIWAIQSSQTSGWQDYLKTNEVCKWSDRCGNPCPPGWRIPTMAEINNLIPSSKSVTDYSAEVKTIGQDKYAFRYKVDTADGIPCIKITSVKTTKSSVEYNDAIFNGIAPLVIKALGLCSFTGDRGYYLRRACVWFDGSYQGGGYSGIAAGYLKIIFEGNTAKFSLSYTDRINAMTIIPVRDNSATPDDLKPIFPIGGHFL